MNTVKVRDIKMGAGAPKIIVPIVGVTKKDIIDEAKTFDSIPVDVVEWRVDWFEHVFEFDKVEEVLKELREALGNIPILMTSVLPKRAARKQLSRKHMQSLISKQHKTDMLILLMWKFSQVTRYVKKSSTAFMQQV